MAGLKNRRRASMLRHSVPPVKFVGSRPDVTPYPHGRLPWLPSLISMTNGTTDPNRP